jgi:hypothetical protein
MVHYRHLPIGMNNLGNSTAANWTLLLPLSYFFKLTLVHRFIQLKQKVWLQLLSLLYDLDHKILLFLVCAGILCKR